MIKENLPHVLADDNELNYENKVILLQNVVVYNSHEEIIKDVSTEDLLINDNVVHANLTTLKV